jgi:hypothetical protein
MNCCRDHALSTSLSRFGIPLTAAIAQIMEYRILINRMAANPPSGFSPAKAPSG